MLDFYRAQGAAAIIAGSLSRACAARMKPASGRACALHVFSSAPVARSLVKAAAAAIAGFFIASTPAFAQAQDKFPSRPISVVVPSTSGGSVEFQTRILAEIFREKHGQPWVIELRPGAMGATGATYASRAAPDGYTLFASPNSPLVFNPLTHKQLAYDPTKFTPIFMMSTQPLVMATRGDFPGESMSDLVDYARKNPERIY